MSEDIKGWRLLLGYVGLFVMIVGAILLIPLIMLFFYPSEWENAPYFLIPGISSIALGFFLFLLIKGKGKGRLGKRQDLGLVLLVWSLSIVISACPFLLTGNYDFTQAVFEATSGYTTTGLSVVDVATCPHIFLFYRSLMLFFGGVGFVLILTSAVSDRGDFNIYLLEGHNDQLLPNLIKSSRLIFAIYLFYVILGTGLYLLVGMNWFDALNHSMAAISTGGFSTNPLSIQGFHSIGVEVVSIFLMLLGSTNFIIHYFLLRAKFKKAFHHFEFFVLVGLAVILLPMMVSSFLWKGVGWEMSIRYSVFEFVSAVTTTGFQLVPSYTGVPGTVFLSIILLMVVGGQAGSTSGGIKEGRVAIAFLGTWDALRKKTRPEHVIRTRFVPRFGENTPLLASEVQEAGSFVAIYITILLTGSLLISLFGFSFQDSLFEFASALGTVGLSVGITAKAAPSFVLWVEILGMFLGRLEILPVLNLVLEGHNWVGKIKWKRT